MNLFVIETLTGNSWAPLEHPTHPETIPVAAFLTIERAKEQVVMALIAETLDPPGPVCTKRLRIVCYRNTTKLDRDYHYTGSIEMRDFGDQALTAQKQWAKDTYEFERAKILAEDADEA